MTRLNLTKLYKCPKCDKRFLLIDKEEKQFSKTKNESANYILKICGLCRSAWRT